MNQQQFIQKGKGKLPILILKWIWKNLDKIDDIVDWLIETRDLLKKK